MVTSAPGCLLVGDDRIKGETLTECEAPQADAFMRLSLVLVGAHFGLFFYFHFWTLTQIGALTFLF